MFYLGLYNNNLTAITSEIVQRENNRRMVYFKSHKGNYIRHNKSDNIVDLATALLILLWKTSGFFYG